MQDNQANDYILEDKSMKTAQFADSTPTVSTRDMRSMFTSNFAYHLMQQMQNPDNTGGLPYIKYIAEYLSTNHGFPSFKQFASNITHMMEKQRSFFVSIDFDKFNGRILALVKIGDEYGLINFWVGETKESFYILRTNEPLLFEAKYYSPYNLGVVIIIGTDQVFIIDLHEFEHLGSMNIDLTTKSASVRADIPFNAPELKKTLAIKNSTSVSISKGNSFLLFWSPFSKVINIFTYYNHENTQHRLGHYIDTVEFSKINTEIVILYDSKKNKRAITILNLKKDFSQTLDINSAMIKRECDYRRIPFEKNDDMVANLVGKSDKLVIVKNGCLLVFENINYDMNYFDLYVGPMFYKLKTVTHVSEKVSIDNKVPYDHTFQIETCHSDEGVVIYSSRMVSDQLQIYMCYYDLNTNVVVRRVICEKIPRELQNGEYQLLGKFWSHPSIPFLDIFKKPYVVFIRKPKAPGSYPGSINQYLKIFEVEGAQQI